MGRPVRLATVKPTPRLGPHQDFSRSMSANEFSYARKARSVCDPSSWAIHGSTASDRQAKVSRRVKRKAQRRAGLGRRLALRQSTQRDGLAFMKGDLQVEHTYREHARIAASRLGRKKRIRGAPLQAIESG